MHSFKKTPNSADFAIVTGVIAEASVNIAPVLQKD